MMEASGERDLSSVDVEVILSARDGVLALLLFPEGDFDVDDDDNEAT